MLQKPYNVSLKGITIDANKNNDVTWQVSGDIQTSFKIDILLNSDNSLVWTSNQITSYALKYTIPQGTLTNGIEYKIKITIYNQAAQSITSDGDIFQTSSTPVVTVDDIGTVNSFSYNFTAQYFQAENVSLRSYIVNLYDSKKNLISKSDILISLPLKYLFSNLQTETDYYIEFQATSSKGLIGTSGLVLFSVFYYRPKMNISLSASNIDNAGIELSWFVRQIIGQTDASKFIGNEKIDTTDGTKVWFDSGFSVNQDFSLKVWLMGIANRQDLITLYGDNGKITLQYYWIDNKFHLSKIDNTGLITNYESNTLSGTSFIILIEQIGMNLNIQAQIIS